MANTGPYALCRNPMYLATFTISAALGVAVDTLWLVLGSNVALFLYLDKVVVPAEEKFLEKQLGDSYRMYCKEVKRWGLF